MEQVFNSSPSRLFLPLRVYRWEKNPTWVFCFSTCSGWMLATMTGCTSRLLPSLSESPKSWGKSAISITIPIFLWFCFFSWCRKSWHDCVLLLLGCHHLQTEVSPHCPISALLQTSTSAAKGSGWGLKASVQPRTVQGCSILAYP